MLSQNGSRDRRVQPRHITQIEMILFNQNESFKTRSLNVSLSGALLECLVPETFMRRPIEIVMILPNGKRALAKAMMLGGPRQSARLMFMNFDKQTEVALNSHLKTEPIAA